MIESKYGVGQELWQLCERADWTGGICDYCGGRLYQNNRWIVAETPRVVHEIFAIGGDVTYVAYGQGGGYRIEVAESEIGDMFYTSQEEANAEAEKRNKGA